MAVRAKFVCSGKNETGVCLNSKATIITLTPVTNGSEENKTFWKYTPCGKIELSTVNQNAADQFEVGKEYYIDFTPAVQELNQLSETVQQTSQVATNTFVCPDTSSK